MLVSMFISSLKLFISKQYLEIQQNRGQFITPLKMQCLITCIKFQHLAFYILQSSVSRNVNLISLLAKYFWEPELPELGFLSVYNITAIFVMKYFQLYTLVPESLRFFIFRCELMVYFLQQVKVVSLFFVVSHVHFECCENIVGYTENSNS